jgi:hypothetical protein
MSRQYPECPLYNHATCKELHNPKLCALVKADRVCLRKHVKSRSPSADAPEGDD